MDHTERQLFEFDSFLLDVQGRVLLREGAVVRLTPKALDVLLLLVRNSGLVVEKEVLLKEVWAETFVEEASLARSIHELRRVLGDDSSQPRFIETIPKRGYRFVTPVQSRSIDRTRDELVVERRVVARLTTQEGEDLEIAEVPARGALQANSHRAFRIRLFAGLSVLIAVAGVLVWLAFIKRAGNLPADQPRRLLAFRREPRVLPELVQEIRPGVVAPGMET